MQSSALITKCIMYLPGILLHQYYKWLTLG